MLQTKQSKTWLEQLGGIELTITSHTASCLTYFLRKGKMKLAAKTKEERH